MSFGILLNVAELLNQVLNKIQMIRDIHKEEKEIFDDDMNVVLFDLEHKVNLH